MIVVEIAIALKRETQTYRQYMSTLYTIKDLFATDYFSFLGVDNLIGKLFKIYRYISFSCIPRSSLLDQKWSKYFYYFPGAHN